MAVAFDYHEPRSVAEGVALAGRLGSAASFIAGGTDLMIDAQFKKLPLETLNDYNLKRKFIRAVAYDIRGTEFTSLETNLDCVGGISDSILRYFIRAFADEVREFTAFSQGK